MSPPGKNQRACSESAHKVAATCRWHEIDEQQMVAIRSPGRRPLHYLAVEPRLLNLRAGRSCADRLDRCDFRGANALDRGDTRACGSAVDMDRAGAAQCHTSTECCAGQAKHVAQLP